MSQLLVCVEDIGAVAMALFFCFLSLTDYQHPALHPLYNHTSS
jgi:hypothetical protein